MTTDNSDFQINTRFIKEAKQRANNEAWMWRYLSGEPREGWREHAACRGIDTDWFYPDNRESKRPPQQVLDVCVHCPVRLDCGKQLVREESENNADSIHGVRAGMAARTREKLYTRMRRHGIR